MDRIEPFTSMTTKFFGPICLVLFIIQSSTFSQPRAFTKDIRLVHFHSEVMSQERFALVMLPPGYDSAPGKRYPVLYMQDGQSVFANWRIDELAQPLFANGQVEPLIFVAIFNGDTKECWRPLRESNPCRRREREGTYCNSRELRGMDSTLPQLEDSRERLLDA
jgi:enterochelin esterase-like enzyme